MVRLVVVLQFLDPPYSPPPTPTFPSVPRVDPVCNRRVGFQQVPAGPILPVMFLFFNHDDDYIGTSNGASMVVPVVFPGESCETNKKERKKRS